MRHTGVYVRRCVSFRIGAAAAPQRAEARCFVRSSLVDHAKRLLVAPLMFLVLGFSVNAQTSNGAIAGSILDSSGSAVPDAQLTATGAGTNSVYNAVSSSTGAYRFSDLVLGTYNISV